MSLRSIAEIAEDGTLASRGIDPQDEILRVPALR